MDSNPAKPRINGSMLSNFQGKTVCLFGMADNTDHSGMSFQLKTSDNENINVLMVEPLQEMVQGLVEVHGVIQGNEIQCQNYVLLPQEGSQNFDMAAYDKAVKMIHKFKSHYTTF